MTRTDMIHLVHFTGSGWMAIFGLGFVMATETVIWAVVHDPAIMAPRSWWLMSGYLVAAAYCVALDFILRIRDKKRGIQIPAGHSLMSVPVRYWSIFYIFMGVARVYSPKEHVAYHSPEQSAGLSRHSFPAKADATGRSTVAVHVRSGGCSAVGR